jgi:anti-sigma factor ChrR (cupin superfamily)
MADEPTRIVLPNLFGPGADLDALPWQPFHKGVEIVRIYDSPNGAHAALLRYEPDSGVPDHRHIGHEHIIVLRGDQHDEHDTFQTGALVVNPPGTTHEVKSRQGCVVLVIWERPVKFTE